MPEHDNRTSAAPVKEPEFWGLAQTLVWIAARDHEAFRIPAGRCGLEPLHISDDSGASGFRLVATDYIREFRWGTITDLTTEEEEEVADAEKELLNHIRRGVLTAWLDGSLLHDLEFLKANVLIRRGNILKLKSLKWTETQVSIITDNVVKCTSLDPVEFFERHRVSFERADVERLWPAKKPGPKVGQASPKSEWCHKAEKILGAGQVSLEHGVMTEIANRIQADGYPHHAPRTIADAIGPTVRAWIKRQKSAA